MWNLNFFFFRTAAIYNCDPTTPIEILVIYCLFLMWNNYTLYINDGCSQCDIRKEKDGLIWVIKGTTSSRLSLHTAAYRLYVVTLVEMESPLHTDTLAAIQLAKHQLPCMALHCTAHV